MSDKTSSPKVFISYSHDSAEHAKKVLKLAEALKKYRICTIIDQDVKNPVEGWPKWMIKNIELSNVVLLVCTEEYSKRFIGEGEGKGVVWEGHLIINDLYENKTINEKYIPVYFGDDAKHVPLIFRGSTSYSIDISSANLVEDLAFQRLYEQICKKFPGGCPHRIIVFSNGNLKETNEKILQKKFETINHKLTQHLQKNAIDFHVQQLGSLDEIRLLFDRLKPALIHFSGGLAIDPSSAELHQEISGNEYLMLTPTILDSIFNPRRENHKIEGVIIQARYSAEQAKAIAENIPFVIGIPSGLSDGLITEFLIDFYKHYQNMKQIDFAFTDSTLNLYENNPQEKEHLPILLEINKKGDLVKYDEEEKLRELKKKLEEKILESSALEEQIQIKENQRDDRLEKKLVTSPYRILAEWVIENKRILIDKMADNSAKIHSDSIEIFHGEIDMIFDFIIEDLASGRLFYVKKQNFLANFKGLFSDIK